MPNTTTPNKPWTFLAYMAGDNTLDAAGPVDLKEMKKVGSSDKLNLIAQLDRATGHSCQRYYLRKGTALAADSVAKLGKIDTGDPKNLSDFIAWGIQNYPADHYALVLWNHGGGWDDTDVYADERYRGLRRLPGRTRHALFHTPVRRTLEKAKKDEVSRAILYDDNAKDFLDNQEMKKVLAGAAKLLKRNLDLLGMDACLMSMVEEGCQISQSTDYTVGSEETEPGDGWPYNKVLAELAKNPTMTPRDFSAAIVKDYLASYAPADGVTYSACDLSKTGALVQSVAALGQALKSKLADTATLEKLVNVRARVQHYEVANNIDLVDFCTLLAAALPGTAIATACANVNAVVKNSYVFASGSKGSGVKNSNGVAIYFPTDLVSPLYAGLDFSQQTGWDKFLESYLAAIQNR